MPLRIDYTAGSSCYLDFEEFPLPLELINDQLEKHLPESGSIEDIGIIEDIHIYIYKFANTERFSSTSLLKIPIKKDHTAQAIPSKLEYNVGWSFYSLVPDYKLDLKRDFPNSTLELRDDYIFPKPKNEDERMESMFTTIKQSYRLDQEDSEFTVEKVAGRGNQDKFCEFTGGGDICISKKRDISSLTMSILAELDNLETSPSNSRECITSITIEGKKKKYN